MDSVTQLAVLADFGVFLVLAGKVSIRGFEECFCIDGEHWQSLLAYDLETLLHSVPQSAEGFANPPILYDFHDIEFFNVGTIQGRTLVVYMRKQEVRASTYSALAPSLCFYY